MENQGGIFYTVDVDTSKLLSTSKLVDQQFGGIETAAKSTDSAIKGVGATSTRTASEMKPLAGAIKEVNSEAIYGASALGKLSAVMGGLLGIGAAQYAIHTAESYGEMSERIQMATKDAEEYTLVQTRLLTNANETYRSLGEAQELYIRTANALRSLGYTTNQALDITDSFSLAMVKNATTVDRGKEAISAYSKAIAKGKVEADNWESIT